MSTSDATLVAAPDSDAADVFLSYAHEDRGVAESIAAGLEAGGLRVWWDPRLYGGDDFGAVIERHIGLARLVVVLWSSSSVISVYVRDEATRAREKHKLLPLRIADVPHPLGFGQLHTALESHNHDQARLLLNEARDCDPEYAPAYYFLAQVLIQQGERNDARAYLQRTLALAQSSSQLDSGQLRNANEFLRVLATVSEPAPSTEDAQPTSPDSSSGDDVPPSLPLSGQALDVLRERVAGLFGSDKQARVAATTALVADLDACSDAVPLALELALSKRSEGFADHYPNASGAINVLVLLRTSLPGTLLLNARLLDPLMIALKGQGDQTAALLRELAAKRVSARKLWPTVTIQIANEQQRPFAERMLARWRKAHFPTVT